MSAIKHPEYPRRPICLVVAVETMVLAGRTVPISYAQQTVVNRRVTTSLFLPIRWTPGAAVTGRPTEAELRMALAGADTLRRLTLEDLKEGADPLAVYEVAGNILRTAAETDLLVVTHGVRPGLEAMLAAVESRLDKKLPPLSVVDTAVLERARRGGHQARPGESPGAFYRRMAALDGDLPDLQMCRLEQEWVDKTILPEDCLFPVFSTYLIYQHYMGLRLRKPPGRTRGAR